MDRADVLKAVETDQHLRVVAGRHLRCESGRNGESRTFKLEGVAIEAEREVVLLFVVEAPSLVKNDLVGQSPNRVWRFCVS